LVVGAFAALVTLLTSILSSLVVAAVSGRESQFPPVAELSLTLLAIWLVAVTFIAFGYALGTLTRSTLVAVVVAVVWVLGVEALLVGMLAPVIPFLSSLQPLLPAGATAALAAGPAATATTTGAAVAVLVAWTVIA